jgi:hypothetical protein
MEKQTIRERFNERVRTLGNKIAPNILPFAEWRQEAKYGLGDLLNIKVNFRKAGAIAGASTPLAFFYGIDAGVRALTGAEPNLPPALMYLGTFPISMPLSAVLGFGGYRLGKKIDTTLNSFREKIFQRK